MAGTDDPFNIAKNLANKLLWWKPYSFHVIRYFQTSLIDVMHLIRFGTIRWRLIEHSQLQSCFILHFYFGQSWCSLISYLIIFFLLYITIDNNFVVNFLMAIVVHWYTHLFSCYIIITISSFIYLTILSYLLSELVINFSFFSCTLS